MSYNILSNHLRSSKAKLSRADNDIDFSSDNIIEDAASMGIN